ncbi:hypothetical protein SAXI111661_02460 [Saccharomonospora xinjiangensis]|uniref:hypothetical protein n=1 Tax=Saccharomonospora xinjiangensis TaxID=75294 RepID=UPI00106FEBCD|nr:hypothetical protein [Saccharomonospora xinjiangensis]QBQ61993.1 hypothetical protein EYD13_18260 [Saccharomonospora xinjiangensis]
MSNEFHLPEDRSLPPHVRDRMLSSVRREMQQPRTRSMRAPLSIAAAVAVLAGGAFVTVGAVGGESEADRVASASGSRDLDRCWAAVEKAGKAAEYPDRETWQVMDDRSLRLTTLTMIKADQQSIFCETSMTSVAVSKPTTSKAQQIDGVMATPNGTVVGHAPSSVTAVAVWSDGLESDDPTSTHAVSGYGRHDSEVEVQDGVFVAELAHHDITGLQFTATTITQADPAQEREIDETAIRVPEPLVYVIDRPVDENRSTRDEAQRGLESCLEGPGGEAGGPVVDAPTWRAGAVLDQQVKEDTGKGKSAAAYDLEWRVALNDHVTAVCRVSPVWRFSAYPSPDELTSAKQPIATVTGENHVSGLSLVGVTSEEIARIELRHGEDTEIVSVRDRTFAATLASADGEPFEASKIAVVAYDADGKVVHAGRLPDIPKQ